MIADPEAQLSDDDARELREAARQVRLQVLEMFVRSAKGHFGGCYSVTEILVTLYWRILRVDPEHPLCEDRDRLILSKGHANAALSAVLAHRGFFDPARLASYGNFSSAFGMHVDMHSVPGCDMSAGSLGHGLAVGAGMALAGRADAKDYRVYVVVGDGECDEGSVWEAAMMAAHHRLANLTVIVDRNGISQCGFTEDIMQLEPFADKWRSFGWAVSEIDGHDVRHLYSALHGARRSEKPTAIIARTVKGKGVSFMEDNPDYHSGSLDSGALDLARAELAAQR